MTDQSQSWYVAGKGGEPTGPFTADDLIRSWQAGRLDPNTLCWCEGMPQWLPLAQVEPFASAIRAATASRQATRDSASQPLLPTQPRTAASSSGPPGVKKTSRVPVALKLLPFIASFVVIGGLGAAYLLMGGLQRNDSAGIPPRDVRNGSPSTGASKRETVKRGGPTNEGKPDNTAASTNQEAERTAPSESATWPTSEGKRSSDMADTRRVRDDTVPQEPSQDSNVAGQSALRPGNRKVAPGTMRSSPASVGRNEPEQIAGVRTMPRFMEPPLECTCPCWSPDGKYVMFIARPTEQAGGIASEGRRDSGAPPRNVWVISADGSKRWLVTNFFFGTLAPPRGRQADPLRLDVRSVAWSPDGQRVAFHAGESKAGQSGTNLYVMKADATDIFQVSKDKGWGELGDTLQWMPNGKGLLLSGGRTAMIDLDSTELHPLTGPGGSILANACSSRDGNKLAAIAQQGTQTGLCIIAKQSRQVKWLNLGPQGGAVRIAHHPRSWSPNARQIAAGATNDVGLDRYIALLDVAGGNVSRLVDGAAPSWSPDGKRIAFEGGLGDQGNLYLIGPDGKNLQRITNLTPPGVQMIWGSQPRCSPDGKQIVFRRGQHVWIANLDGSGETCVIQGSDYVRGYEHARWWPCKWTPFWKSDGSVVFARYFRRDSMDIEVCATGVNSDAVHRIFVWKSPTLALKSPNDTDEVCWSPDGTKIAFDNNENIWVAKGDGTQQTRLTGGRNPRWSPDGEKILFARGSENNEVLCIINADGSNQTQITEPSDGYRAHHSWSPDAKTIAFQGKNGLLVVSAGGGNARRLVWGHQPCWSPDGRRMAFCAMGRLTGDTTAQGPPCVYVMNADATGMRPVMQVDRTGYGNNPVNNLSWSPDGKHLVFEETAKRGYDYENQHHIWIVDVSEPVFYQASYVASDLLPWKVPQFDSAPQPGSLGVAEEQAPTPGAKELPPADKKPADGEPQAKGALSGTWQATAGATFKIIDDGKTATINLESSDTLQSLSGKLTRRDANAAPKSLTGSFEAVFKLDTRKPYNVRVTVTIDDDNHLKLNCEGWPVLNQKTGRYIISTRPLTETWTRLGAGDPAAR